MRGSWLAAGLATVATVLVTGCGPAPKAAAYRPVVEDASEPFGPGRWFYSTSTDEMSGQVSDTACVFASEVAGQPADPVASPMLCFYRHGGSIDDADLNMRGTGEIDCQQCGVRVKADDGKPVSLLADAIVLDGTKYLQFLRAGGLLAQVRAGKKLTVEVPLTEMVNRLVVFRVDDLAWLKPSGAPKAGKP